jgi:hypothetical protein
MSKIFVTPKPGLRVRREDGHILAAGGETVERDSFWLRRIKDGDVTAKSSNHGGTVNTLIPAKSKK